MLEILHGGTRQFHLNHALIYLNRKKETSLLSQNWHFHWKKKIYILICKQDSTTREKYDNIAQQEESKA